MVCPLKKLKNCKYPYFVVSNGGAYTKHIYAASQRIASKLGNIDGFGADLVFFYHPDHLGSTSYVTDADGNIAQHIEYIPYGEIFMEERNNSFSTSYLFNAKDLDNETGLYYYGARYLDPTGAMWLSVDPMWEKYAGMSPYNYCMGKEPLLI